jgi:hypothetical protein
MTAAWQVAAGRSIAGRRGRGVRRNTRRAHWIQATPPQHEPQRRYAAFTRRAVQHSRRQPYRHTAIDAGTHRIQLLSPLAWL